MGFVKIKSISLLLLPTLMLLLVACGGSNHNPLMAEFDSWVLDPHRYSKEAFVTVASWSDWRK